MHQLSRRHWLARSLVGLAVACFIMVQSSGAVAAGPDVEQLRKQGKLAFEAQRYTEAKKAFDEAFRLSKSPSSGLWAARSRIELGQWLDASKLLGHVAEIKLPDSASDSEKEARRQALKEWAQIRGRIPSLRVFVVGVEPHRVDVRVDGVRLGPEYLKKTTGPFGRGKALKLDPGSHRVIGVMGDVRRETTVTLKGGEGREVSLKFPDPDTLRQRKCRDDCRSDCGGDTDCYIECKHKCFRQKQKPKKKEKRKRK